MGSLKFTYTDTFNNTTLTLDTTTDPVMNVSEVLSKVRCFLNGCGYNINGALIIEPENTPSKDWNEFFLTTNDWYYLTSPGYETISIDSTTTGYDNAFRTF